MILIEQGSSFSGHSRAYLTSALLSDGKNWIETYPLGLAQQVHLWHLVQAEDEGLEKS